MFIPKIPDKKSVPVAVQELGSELACPSPRGRGQGRESAAETVQEREELLLLSSPLPNPPRTGEGTSGQLFIRDRYTRRFYVKLIVFAVVLLLVGGHTTKHLLERNVGVDFYQYWAVGLGPKISAGALKSPYIDLPKYVATFDAQVKKSNDLRLFAANKLDHRFYEQGLDIPGTPLLYAAFSGLSSDYSFAFFIFTATKMVFALASILLLVLKANTKLPLLMAVSVGLALGYGPLVNDIKAGNIAAFQLFIIVFLAHVLEKGTDRTPYISGIVFMSFLAMFLLIKPNVLFIAAALSGSFWALRGGKVFLISSIAAAAFTAMLVVLPCMYYGSWSVWTDWYAYLSQVGDKGFYPVKNGNVSTTLSLANAFGVSSGVVWPITLSVLAAHGLRTIAKAGTSFRKSAAQVLRDPFLCVSLSVVVTLAISPLVWHHYYVLSLIPAYWLLSKPTDVGRLHYLALISLLLSAELLPAYIPALRSGSLQYWLMSTAWIPLWVGTQKVIKARLKTAFRAEAFFTEVSFKKAA